MHHTSFGLIFAVVVLTTGLTSVAQAEHPPRPGSDDSGLTENQTASLWSREPDTCQSERAYKRDHGTDRTVLQALASCTDITFAAPPATAARWTTSDFQSLEPGGRDTAVSPDHANLEQSGPIRDAHATIFAVQPSTIAHRDASEPSLYVAPEGQLRGFVDYRVQVPADDRTGSRTVEWSLREHEVTAVRIKQDGRQLAEIDGDQTPVFDYQLDGSGPSTLTFEAEIKVELEKKITDRSGNTTTVRYSYPTESLTVSHDREIRVYDLTAVVYEASYPDGDVGLAVYQSQPWHGYTLSDEGARVRGVWRYYTARDTDWDRLVRARQSGQQTVHSDALPVYVHAYPSRVGPRTDPIRSGPELLEVWGTKSESPAPTLHENVAVGVVDEPYTQSYGLAVRHADIDSQAFDAQGIVRGETADIVAPDAGRTREIRESELTATMSDQTPQAAIIQITLRDAATGDPIILGGTAAEHPRLAPISGTQRAGYITVDGKRIVTNTSGMATVTLSQPGTYTVEYHPGSWRTHDPVYTGARVSVSWHPLATASGWLTLLVRVVQYSIPFLVALYAGLRLGSFLRFQEGSP